MRFHLFLVLLLCSVNSFCQQDTVQTKKLIDSINTAVDHAVVKKDIPFLQAHFADDFRFVHGTGMIDSKESWIGKAQMPRVQYLGRENDSTFVELHGNTAVVTGSLTVTLPGGLPRSGYIIRYLRVYALRDKRWQMISHHTTMQWDIPRTK